MNTITNARQAYDYDSTVEPSEQVIKISGEKQKETVRTSPRARNINQQIETQPQTVRTNRRAKRAKLRAQRNAASTAIRWN